jgi:hypothetical protein
MGVRIEHFSDPQISSSDDRFGALPAIDAVD